MNTSLLSMFNGRPIDGLWFGGPYYMARAVPEVAGVYVVTASDPRGNERVLDVGESSNVRERLGNHDREGCWRWNALGNPVSFWVYSEVEWLLRRGIEAKLRAALQPTCGER